MSYVYNSTRECPLKFYPCFALGAGPGRFPYVIRSVPFRIRFSPPRHTHTDYCTIVSIRYTVTHYMKYRVRETVPSCGPSARAICDGTERILFDWPHRVMASDRTVPLGSAIYVGKIVACRVGARRPGCRRLSAEAALGLGHRSSVSETRRGVCFSGQWLAPAS